MPAAVSWLLLGNRLNVDVSLFSELAEMVVVALTPAWLNEDWIVDSAVGIWLPLSSDPKLLVDCNELVEKPTLPPLLSSLLVLKNVGLKGVTV